MSAVLWRLIILSEREMDREMERKGKEDKNVYTNFRRPGEKNSHFNHLEEAAGHWRGQTL